MLGTAVRIMAARRLSTYLAFIDFLRKSLRVTRSGEAEVPETCVSFFCRARPVPSTPPQAYLRYARDRDAPPPPTPPRTGARHPHRETSSAPLPMPSPHSYPRSQSPATAAPAPRESIGETTPRNHSPDLRVRRKRASDDMTATARD